MKAHKIPYISVEEYVKAENESKTKHEYHDGKIFALAGGTLNHGLLCGNAYSEIRNKLKTKGSNCVPFTSEVKIYIGKRNSYVYPDSLVICGDIEKSEVEINSIINPILIVEVLSKSTAEYDRGDKFYFYRQLQSFKEYILIEQDRHIVDVHFKNKNSDLWKITRYEGLGKIIKIHSLDIEITMEELYFRTEIDTPL
jgi:Uma2 family endonuclease